MLSKIKLYILIISIFVISGCAKTPSGISPIDIREMTVNASFAGPINENYYYYFPIDLMDGGLGPVPVFPGNIGGSTWITGSADYYIQYHQRQYSMNKITNLDPFESEQIGSPLRYVLPSNGSHFLNFTVDLNSLASLGESVEINMISIDQPFSTPRFLDAIGIRGTDFININITNNMIYTNQESNIESINDLLDQNGVNQQPDDATKSLDISDWTISIGD